MQGIVHCECGSASGTLAAPSPSACHSGLGCNLNASATGSGLVYNAHALVVGTMHFKLMFAKAHLRFY